jgi:hypothetical protein
MTRNAAINLAIKTLRRWSREYYGWEAKYKPEARAEYDKFMEAIRILESLKEEKHE